jgi:hypothetical protein
VRGDDPREEGETGPARSPSEVWEAIGQGDEDRPVAFESDPVFRSLGAGLAPPDAGEVEGGPSSESAVAVPMGRNVFALCPLPPQATRAEFLATAGAPSEAEPAEGSPAWLDEPERERIAAVATRFVDAHVRRIESAEIVFTPSRHFTVGTAVVSALPLPKGRFRHAAFSWAITSGTVVELDDARLPIGRLGRVGDTIGIDLPGCVRGDQHELAYLLAYVLELLDVRPAAPIAAIGALGLDTNSALIVDDIDPYLEAAEADGMHDLVLPWANARLGTRDGAVTYWPVRDANDAVFSVLTALSTEIVTPDLRR